MGKPGPDQQKTDKQILRELVMVQGPVATATEIADRVGYSRQNVSRILKRLYEEGYVDSKQVGARAKVYWLTNKGQQFVAKPD